MAKSEIEKKVEELERRVAVLIKAFKGHSHDVNAQASTQVCRTTRPGAFSELDALDTKPNERPL